MTYLPPATPEEMAEPGWEGRRNDAWYGKRAEWIKGMEAAGFRVKLKKMGRGKHPPPASTDLEPEPG